MKLFQWDLDKKLESYLITVFLLNLES
uniref:Uncharacterized protein n=1 Tax=Anguilla anguilla TaxID=7936 RepID=A0A0E9T3G2_ANGAN